MASCKKNTIDKVSQPIETGTVMDIDSNVYKTVKIGNQWWMAENLNVTRYNDSTPILEIPIFSADSVWAQNALPAMCIVDTAYHRLYNWYSIASNKNIAPKGWHIPTDEEWKLLETTIGISSTDVEKFAWRGLIAGKLLPLNTIGWPMYSTVYGTNDFGFSALPGGCRVFDGTTNSESNACFWWTETETENKAIYRYLDSQKKGIFRQSTLKTYGFSIRCIKD